MAILEDIARRKGIKHIYLDAMPERVSYYLGLDPPYVIADNNNGAKKAMFNEVFADTFAKRKTAGNTNEVARTAARSAAGNSLLGGDDGEPLVEMTKTLPRKTRRNRRNRRNRKGKRK